MKRSIAKIVYLSAALGCAGPAVAQPYGTPGPGPRYPITRDQPGGLWSKHALEYDRTFTGIINSAQELEKKLRSPAAQTNIHEVTVNAAFLQQKWRDWLKYNPEDYRRGGAADRYLNGLKTAQQLLKEAGKTKDLELAAQKLEDAAADLAAKADNCRYSADGLGKVVQVRVRTLGDAGELAGYEVWFVQRGLLPVKSAHDRFYKLSSPTDELDLPPGGYAFWARKDESSTEPVPIRVGGKGQKQIEIELRVKEP